MTLEVSAAEHGKTPIDARLIPDTNLRHVFVTLELICSASLEALTDAKYWTKGADCVCIQAQANVSQVDKVLTKRQAKIALARAVKAKAARAAHAAADKKRARASARPRRLG